MDVGESKNVYANPEEAKPAGSGLFKIGDYDNNPKSNSEKQPGLVQQTGQSIKNVVEKLVGKKD